MLPCRTNWGAPTELSPQKPDAPPIRTTFSGEFCAVVMHDIPSDHAVQLSNLLLAGPDRLAFLAKCQLSLLGIVRQRHQADLAFHESDRFLERHRFHCLHRVEAA